jgi:hypothetical protein
MQRQEAAMNRSLTIVLVLSAILIVIPRAGWPDGECTPNALHRDTFNTALAAEKSGNLPLAFSAFDFAQGKYGCDGPNPSAQTAAEGRKRTGLALAKAAEANGRLHAYGSVESVGKPGGLRLNQRNGDGAFQWYREVGETADADRVMFRWAQSTPTNPNTFRTALEHFLGEGRTGGENRPETFPEMEKFATSTPGDQQLQRTVGYLKDLQKIALKNVDDALASENTAYGGYKKGETVIGQSPVEDSINHLGFARDWCDLFGHPRAATLAERAGKRGDAMMQDERPKSYWQAKQYYDLGHLPDRIKKLTAQANKLGDAAAKKGEYAWAVEYYEIGHSVTGENEAKINELQSRLTEESQQKERATQKALKDMTKDDKQQKDFKKGQEDLEKELGF